MNPARALRAFARLRATGPSAAPAPRASSTCGQGHLPQTSCADTPPPPCPVCPPRPPPPCRARPEERIRAVRVTCCPPPQGQRPPCAPPLPPCPLTCADVVLSPSKLARPKEPSALSAEGKIVPTECGAMRTKVTARLAAARLTRQRDYEREAAARGPECLPSVPPAPFTLSGERECVCATDGKQYVVQSCSTPAQRCGSCRAAPEPRCVNLVPDDGCTPPAAAARGSLDPCAHRPRVLVSIDRSASTAVSSPASGETSSHADKDNNAPQPTTGKTEKGPWSECFSSSEKSASKKLGVHSAPPAHTPQSSGLPGSKEARSGTQNRPSGRSITSRLMQCLGNTNSAGAAQKIARPSSGVKCSPPKPGHASRAGDVQWCNNVKKPATGPRPCREPTVKEKLRRRTRPPCVPPCRRLHFSAANFARPVSEKKDLASIVADTKAKAGKLAAVLEERSSLKEAGVGRRGGTRDCSPKPPPPPPPPVKGNFDLEVPPSIGGLRVSVIVEEKRVNKPNTCDSPCNRKTGSKPGTKSGSPCAARTTPKCGPKVVQKSKNPCAPKVVKMQRTESWLSMKSLCSAIAGRRGACSDGKAGKSDKSRTCGPCNKIRSAIPCAKNKSKDPCAKTDTDPQNLKPKKPQNLKSPKKDKSCGKVNPVRPPVSGVQSPCEAGRGPPCSDAGTGRTPRSRDPCRRPPVCAPVPNAKPKDPCNKPSRFSAIDLFPLTIHTEP